MSNVAFGGICLFGGRSYRLNQAQDEALDKFRDNIADEHERGLFQYLDQLNDGIASYRRSKHVDEYDPLKNAQHKSRRMAEIAVGNGFARSRINVTVGRDVGVEVNNPQSQYSKSNDLTVPLTWNKAVSERGFALVQAPDGLRLILRCSHRRIGYVEDEGFNAGKSPLYRSSMARVRSSKASLSRTSRATTAMTTHWLTSMTARRSYRMPMAPASKGFQSSQVSYCEAPNQDAGRLVRPVIATVYTVYKGRNSYSWYKLSLGKKPWHRVCHITSQASHA